MVESRTASSVDRQKDFRMFSYGVPVAGKTFWTPAAHRRYSEPDPGIAAAFEENLQGVETLFVLRAFSGGRKTYDEGNPRAAPGNTAEKSKRRTEIRL